MRYCGLPTSRAPDTPVPVAREYSRWTQSPRPPVASGQDMPDNNLIEQDHRGVKLRIGPMLGFKWFRTAAITIAGVELLRQIHKGQFDLRALRLKDRTASAVWNAALAA